MLFGDLDENDRRPIRIGDPHLYEAPWLALGRPYDLDVERRKSPVLVRDVAYLQPQRQVWRADCLVSGAGDLQEAATEEEHDRRIRRVAELPVDRKSQYVAVEPSAASQIDRVQQNSTAEYVHASDDPPTSR